MKFTVGAFGAPDLSIDLDELPGGDESVPKAVSLILAWVLEYNVDFSVVVPLHFTTDDNDDIYVNGGSAELFDQLSNVIKLAEYMNEDRRYQYDKCIYALLSDDWNSVDFDNIEDAKDRLTGEYDGDTYSSAREEYWKDRMCELQGGPGDYWDRFIDWDEVADSEEEDYEVITFSGTTYIFDH